MHPQSGTGEEPEELQTGRKRQHREALVAHLVDHISEPLCQESMARHSGISKAHLCREARRLTGATIQQIAEREKMAWAAAAPGGRQARKDSISCMMSSTCAASTPLA